MAEGLAILVPRVHHDYELISWVVGVQVQVRTGITVKAQPKPESVFMQSLIQSVDWIYRSLRERHKSHFFWGKLKIPKLVGDELEGSEEDVPSLCKAHDFL